MYANIKIYRDIYIAVYFSVRLSECQELGLWKASSEIQKYCLLNKVNTDFISVYNNWSSLSTV